MRLQADGRRGNDGGRNDTFTKSSLRMGLVLKLTQNPVLVKTCQVAECFKGTCRVSKQNLRWGISATEARDKDNRWECDNSVTDDHNIK